MSVYPDRYAGKGGWGKYINLNVTLLVALMFKTYNGWLWLAMFNMIMTLKEWLKLRYLYCCNPTLLPLMKCIHDIMIYYYKQLINIKKLPQLVKWQGRVNAQS